MGDHPRDRGAEGLEPGNRLGRRDFLTTMMALAAAGYAGAAAPAARERTGRKKPNILLIYADDLGYGDVGCYGSKEAKTPNIDLLASQGAKFTDGHVMASVCSPSRAALLTGRYQQRFGHEDNTGNVQRQAKDDIGLDTGERTLADWLRDEGYATGLIGKWHLGVNEKYRPLKRGFDEFFGFLGGGHSYMQAGDERTGMTYRGNKTIREPEYLTDAFTREAVDFIRRRKDGPFFLDLSYNAVHSPLQAPGKYLDRFPDMKDSPRRTLLAMLSAMDDGVGAAIQTLKDCGIEENTLVFFISDNGGVKNGRNDPFRGNKASPYEGGIRIPFVMRWPGKIPAGREFDGLSCTLDVLPTCLAAARAPEPKGLKLDGVDLLPYLDDRRSGDPHEILFWRRYAEHAVRKGDWKMLCSRRLAPQLYNLADDIGEKKDLAAEKPEVMAELTKAFDEWSAQMAEPKWEWFVQRAASGPAGDEGEGGD